MKNPVPEFASTKNQVVKFAYAFRLGLPFQLPILACNRSRIATLNVVKLSSTLQEACSFIP